MSSIPVLEDFDVSPIHGFLPTDPPLDHLRPYYEPWENVTKNLTGLIISDRLRGLVNTLPVLTTQHLHTEAEWRRAYCVLAFMSHAYVWGGNKPAERIPPPISKPFKEICKHLEVPTVTTYAGAVLWNWKPIFSCESPDTLSNLDTINTFTGSIDEKWFYLVSVAIEARGGAMIPLMLEAVDAARRNDTAAVTNALQIFAERLDELGVILTRMYEHCDPYVFYNRVRVYLAGSKNMADAGLPNGVIFDDGGPMHKQRYVQYSGGSNAQSSIFQFFDLILSVEHRPTGEPKTGKKSTATSFHMEMRKYMPGAHARFLNEVAKVANIREFVEAHRSDTKLTVAFDAALAMLSSIRDKHIQMVSRYIVIQSKKAKDDTPENGKKINLAVRTKAGEKKTLTGTGGSSLVSFLRQARDETSEPAVETWAKRIMSKEKGPAGVRLNVIEKQALQHPTVKGLSGHWTQDENGGLCFA